MVGRLYIFFLLGWPYFQGRTVSFKECAPPKNITLQGTNISRFGTLKMIFLVLRWDILASWRVTEIAWRKSSLIISGAWLWLCKKKIIAGRRRAHRRKSVFPGSRCVAFVLVGRCHSHRFISSRYHFIYRGETSRIFGFLFPNYLGIDAIWLMLHLVWFPDSFVSPFSCPVKTVTFPKPGFILQSGCKFYQ